MVQDVEHDRDAAGPRDREAVRGRVPAVVVLDREPPAEARVERSVRLDEAYHRTPAVAVDAADVDLDHRILVEPEEVEHLRMVHELRNRPLDDRGVLRVQEVELVGMHRDAQAVPPGERPDHGELVGEGLPPWRRADRM